MDRTAQKYFSISVFICLLILQIEIAQGARADNEAPIARASDGENPEQRQLVELHKQISKLIWRGNDVQAEPLMAQYVAQLEKGCCNSESEAGQLKESYQNYADLLERVHKSDEAIKVRAKAAEVHYPTLAQWQKPQVEEFPTGIVGLKFIVRHGSLPTIESTVPGSPAAAAGLQPKDVITEIDGQSLTDGATRDQIFERITGPAGTSVKITVRRANSGLLTVTLNRVKLGELSDPVVRQQYLWAR